MPRTTQADRLRQLRELVSTGRARALRVAAGDTLMVAGRACDVDPGAVNRWERGERTPRGRNLQTYLRYLGRLAVATQDSEPAA